ncbi:MULTISPECIES: hypothetical protein [unclassified Hyphomonas]|nr:MULTISPECIES: hypothetical protein [unclassified Hyphomonas]MAL47881.1 hypothetical protein [Hyphomonas sp.]MDF1805511.1 hypothetical protein [Hyphomonas sp.]HAO36164.1 hypothetical protein [Hyphomonas sp.]
MVWRLPLLNRTLKSLQKSSEQSSTQMLATDDIQKRYEAVKCLAKQRLDRADRLIFEEDIPQQFG